MNEYIYIGILSIIDNESDSQIFQWVGQLLIHFDPYRTIRKCLRFEVKDLLEIWGACREVDFESGNLGLVGQVDWWLVLWVVLIGREEHHLYGEDWKYLGNQHQP